MTIKRASVLGGGAFGTAMAQLLARKGIETRVWMRNEDLVKTINTTHVNDVYLRDFTLSENVIASTSVKHVLEEGTGIVLICIPTPFFRSFLLANMEMFPTGVPIVCCNKGIEKDSFDTPYEIALDELPGKFGKWLGCLAGPSFAQEVVMNLPTNVTVAAGTIEVANSIQTIISDRAFRAYSTTDVLGCELAGAIKNVLAIACGAAEGGQLGRGARAAIITRGLTEVGRLIVAKGGDSKTLLSLAGVGDLVLTCNSAMSRNFTVGLRMARGETLDEIKASTKSVAEGVFTTWSIHQMCKSHKLDMPICEGVYQVLYNDVSFKDALNQLQERPLRLEHDDDQ
eukprot:CFRG1004T1